MRSSPSPASRIHRGSNGSTPATPRWPPRRSARAAALPASGEMGIEGGEEKRLPGLTRAERICVRSGSGNGARSREHVVVSSRLAPARPRGQSLRERKPVRAEVGVASAEGRDDGAAKRRGSEESGDKREREPPPREDVDAREGVRV